MLVILCSCTSIIILFTYFTYFYVIMLQIFQRRIEPYSGGLFGTQFLEEGGGKIAPTLTSD